LSVEDRAEIRRLHRAEAAGQGDRAGADPPPDPVDQLLFRPRHRPARLLPPRQQRLQHCPLRTGQVSTAAHRYGRHKVSVKMVFLIVDSSPTGDLTASSAWGAARGQVTGPPGSGYANSPAAAECRGTD
jgi:hypothetical protein